MHKLLTALLSLILICHISALGQTSENVQLLHNWNDTNTNVVNRIGQRYDDVWGFVQNGKEYAAIGSTEGVHIIDVETGRQVAFGAGTAQGVEIIHRDYKTYKNYLYAVCDEGPSTLQVFDTRYLPDSIHLVWQSDPLQFMLSHNIFIDTAKAKLYACSVKGQLSGNDHMRVYSLANPELPALLTKYNMNSKVHDVFVRNDTAYCSSEFYGYEVVDFSSNDQNWTNIGELTQYSYKGYNHSSWVNEAGIGVIADETHGLPLKVIDARNVSDIQVLGTFIAREDTNCIPHNPYIIGNTVYVAYYMDGFQVFDISDPKNPVRTGYYDTYPGADFKGFAGAWGCYPYLPSGKVLVSDMQTGLYIFKVPNAKDTVKSQNDLMTIYPHPAPSGQPMSIQFTQPITGDIGIAVYDLSGRRCLSQTIPNAAYGNGPIRLTLPGNWASGLYFLTATTAGKTYSAKILKQ